MALNHSPDFPKMNRMKILVLNSEYSVKAIETGIILLIMDKKMTLIYFFRPIFLQY